MHVTKPKQNIPIKDKNHSSKSQRTVSLPDSHLNRKEKVSKENFLVKFTFDNILIPRHVQLEKDVFHYYSLMHVHNNRLIDLRKNH